MLFTLFCLNDAMQRHKMAQLWEASYSTPLEGSIHSVLAKNGTGEALQKTLQDFHILLIPVTPSGR